MSANPCPSCGGTNVAGDRFCGSCGAPLPFRPATAEADTALRAGPGVASVADHEPAAPAGLRDDPQGVPVTVPCPACGHANPAGRTFCRACGSGLPRVAAAVRVPDSGATIPSLAAPIAAMSVAPRSALPTPASSGRAAIAPGTARRQGGKGWLVLIIILGLAAGILWTLLPRLMAGGAPNEALPSTPNPGQVLPAASVPANWPRLEVSA